MKIGIFDSGIGGLTVLKEIIKKYPNGQYIYYGDTLHLPYGEKTNAQLLQYSCYIIDFLLKEKVDKIVIACGTVSTSIYTELKKIYDIEIISVIDSTINALQKENINNLAVLATTKTIENHTFSKKFNNIPVLEIACPKLVPYIEHNIGNKDNIFKEYLEPLNKKNIENIILGCTHYPILQEDIISYFSYPVKCYNMGKFVAESISIQETSYQLTLYFSLVDDNLEKNIKRILETSYNLVAV